MEYVGIVRKMKKRSKQPDHLQQSRCLLLVIPLFERLFEWQEVLTMKIGQ